MTDPRVVVFDIGGVLLDWNPRYLYRELFAGDEGAMERFLAEVCTPAWNASLDAGRPFEDAVRDLAAAHPDQAALIEAYATRWDEMVAGAFDGTVAVLDELRVRGVPVYALSNWARPTFDRTRARFPFLDTFDGIVISGDVGIAKPDRRIFEHLFAAFAIEPGRAVFIDDSAANIAVASELGMTAVPFTSAVALRADLRGLGLVP